jgi:hypothetical protein
MNVELFTIRDMMTPCSFTEKSPVQDGEESGQKSAFPACGIARPEHPASFDKCSLMGDTRPTTGDLTTPFASEEQVCP